MKKYAMISASVHDMIMTDYDFPYMEGLLKEKLIRELVDNTDIGFEVILDNRDGQYKFIISANVEIEDCSKPGQTKLNIEQLYHNADDVYLMNGNPGAYMALGGLLRDHKRILLYYGIRGEQLYMFWNDACGQGNWLFRRLLEELVKHDVFPSTVKNFMNNNKGRFPVYNESVSIKAYLQLKGE